MSRRKFAFYISLGIEANNLLLSGLATQVHKDADVEVLSRYDSRLLKELSDRMNIHLTVIDAFDLMQYQRPRLENYFLGSRRARLRLNGIKTFSLSAHTTDLRFKDYFLGNAAIYTLLDVLTRKKIRSHYYNPALAEYLRQNAFTDLVIQSYNAVDRVSVIVTAQVVGCRVWVMNWGWKDFYINEFIPAVPDGFFTWSDKYKALYGKHNRHIPKGNIHAFGNPSFDRLHAYEPVRPLTFYAEKYGFPADQKIVMYTLVNPEVFDDEPAVVSKIAAKINECFDDVIILLKPNPMDNALHKWDPVAARSNVFLLENLWEYDQENNFNLMTVEARDEWYDLLYYSVVTMNIASTVTVESLLLGKPVINIGFDREDAFEDTMHRLLDAPYYAECLARDDVLVAETVGEVPSLLENIFSAKISVHQKLNEVILSNAHSTGDIATIMTREGGR